MDLLEPVILEPNGDFNILVKILWEFADSAKEAKMETIIKLDDILKVVIMVVGSVVVLIAFVSNS